MAELKLSSLVACPVRQHAQQSPHQIALIERDLRLDYATLDARLNALQQQLLQAGLTRGSHLLTLAANSLPLLLLQWACIRAGILLCPLNPRLPVAALPELASRLDADAIWATPDLASGLPKLSILQLEPQFDAEIPAKGPLWLDSNQLNNLILTSGSSGQPKAVAHRLGTHLISALGSASAIDIGPGDGWLLSLPMHHIGGYAIPVRSFLAGATVLLPDDNQSLAHRLIKDPISHLSLVPTQLYRLLNQPGFQFSQTRLRHLLLGGAPIPNALVEACHAQGIRPKVSYGLSEMGSQVCTRDADGQSSSVGQALPGRELVIQEGEICVRGATLFAGYYQAGRIEPAVDTQGWFHTGDLGELNAQGELRVIGRRDNRFICGGENIQPEEIEQMLLQHEDVQQVIVVPVADEEWGMRPVAFVERQDTRNPSPRTFAQLADWLRIRLPAHLLPRDWLPWPTAEDGNLKPGRKQLATLAQSLLHGD